MESRAGLDDLKNRKSLGPVANQTTIPRSSSPQPGHYTNCVIPTLNQLIKYHNFHQRLSCTTLGWTCTFRTCLPPYKYSVGYHHHVITDLDLMSS